MRRATRGERRPGWYGRRGIPLIAGASALATVATAADWLLGLGVVASAAKDGDAPELQLIVAGGALSLCLLACWRIARHERPHGRGRRSSARAEVVLTAIVIATGVALSAYFLDVPLRVDESRTIVKYASQPFGAALTTVGDMGGDDRLGLLQHTGDGASGPGDRVLDDPGALASAGSRGAERVRRQDRRMVGGGARLRRGTVHAGPGNVGDRRFAGDLQRARHLLHRCDASRAPPALLRCLGPVALDESCVVPGSAVGAGSRRRGRARANVSACRHACSGYGRRHGGRVGGETGPLAAANGGMGAAAVPGPGRRGGGNRVQGAHHPSGSPLAGSRRAVRTTRDDILRRAADSGLLRAMGRAT